MKWFKHKLYQWVLEAGRCEESKQSVMIPQDVCTEESPGWSDGLRINVKKVIGGSVVSFRTYDRVKDRTDERHYIITDEHEFDRELGKIITIESMRQS